MEPILITMEEAASLARTSYKQVDDWANDNADFPSFKLGKKGGKRLVHKRLLDEWLAKRAKLRIGEGF